MGVWLVLAVLGRHRLISCAAAHVTCRAGAELSGHGAELREALRGPVGLVASEISPRSLSLLSFGSSCTLYMCSGSRRGVWS
eukprot:6758053-Prymnesium_polylepis.2